MWFKNVKAFQFNKPFSLNGALLQDQLQAMQFRTCGSQELASMGFVPPIPNGDMLFHQTDSKYWFVLKKQERMLPASVVNNELAEKVAQIEQESGSPVGKKQQKEIKEDIVARLCPQAFTKNTFTHGFICTKSDIVAIDASADGAAEAWLASLRKVLGSLPVVPLAKSSVQDILTQWLMTDAPAGVELLDEAEFKAQSEEASIIRCKSCDLDAPEVLAHLQSGMAVQKLAIAWQEKLTCILAEDLSIKRLKFTDIIKEQTEDVPKDDVRAKLDADFALMSAELVDFIRALKVMFELDEVVSD